MAEDNKIKRWMVRARYSEANTNEYFRLHNDFQDKQWIYVKNTSFTDKEHGSLYVELSSAKGALTKTLNWAFSAGYTLPVHQETAGIIQVAVVIPTDEDIKENYHEI